MPNRGAYEGATLTLPSLCGKKKKKQSALGRQGELRCVLRCAP